MRLLDLEGLISKQLGNLPGQAYRCAMCVIAELVISLYSEYYPPRLNALATRTMEAVWLGAREGDSAGFEAGVGLPEEWKAALEDKSDVTGPPGARTALILLAALSSEMALDGRPRQALAFVTACFATYAGKPYSRPMPRIVISPRTQEIDENSPGVCLLWKIGQVADLAEEQCRDGGPADPHSIRAAVFGDLTTLD